MTGTVFKVALGVLLLFICSSSVVFSQHGVQSQNHKKRDLDGEIDDFSLKIMEILLKNSKKNIAIGTFTDISGNVTDFGKFLTDEIITRLVISNKFNVIERKYFTKILEKTRLPLHIAVGPNIAESLKNLLGIDTIITGTMVELGDKVKVNARLFDASSSDVFGAARMDLLIDDTFRNLLGQLTLEPVEVNLSVKLDDIAKEITQNMVAHKKKKLIMVEFPNLSGDITNLGKFLYEELLTRLMVSNQFDVIEKKLFDSRLEMYDDIVSQNITADIAKELGQTLEADAVAIGTISDLGDVVKVNIRLIDPETSVPFAVASNEISSDKTVKSLLLVTDALLDLGTQTVTLGFGEDINKKISVDKYTRKIVKSGKSRRSFFIEDFAKHSVGDAASKWGEGIVVAESLGAKCITSKTSGENVIKQQIDFTNNFKFDFDVKGVSWTWGSIQFSNRKDDRFKIDFRIKNNYFHVKLPKKNESKVSCNSDEFNTVSIVRKGKEISIYLNDMLVQNDVYMGQSKFTDFEIACRLDTILITNFVGIEVY